MVQYIIISKESSKILFSNLTKDRISYKAIPCKKNNIKYIMGDLAPALLGLRCFSYIAKKGEAELLPSVW
jgi:hypothetical protein